MSTTFITYAPTIGLGFFFTVFLVIAIWALRPANKERFKTYGEMPLREDNYGNQ